MLRPGMLKGGMLKHGLLQFGLLKLGLLTVAGLMVGLAGASAQPAMQSVKIRLDWKGGAQHAPFYFGKQLGYYKEAGIDLEVISGSGSSDTVKQVGSRAVEFGLVDALVLVQAAQQRVPVRAIAAYYQRSPIVLISPKDKPITDPHQLLSGIKLGSKKGSATYQGLIALLSSNNLKLEQINLVDIGFGVAPLLVKQVDAIMGFSMNEPIEAESGGMAVHEMPIADYGVDTYGLTIVTNTSLMQQNPALVKNFLAATERAIQATLKDPAGAVAAVAKAVEEVDSARETKVLARTLPYMSSKQTEQSGFGWQAEERWNGTIEAARKLGLIETALKPEDVFANTFLRGSPQAK
jgi:NitT/TauT family transport system substrate-binding protein